MYGATGGFLGGNFEMGFSNALVAVSNIALPVIMNNEKCKKIPGSSTLSGKKISNMKLNKTIMKFTASCCIA